MRNSILLVIGSALFIFSSVICRTLRMSIFGMTYGGHSDFFFNLIMLFCMSIGILIMYSQLKKCEVNKQKDVKKSRSKRK